MQLIRKKDTIYDTFIHCDDVLDYEIKYLDLVYTNIGNIDRRFTQYRVLALY